MKQYQSWGGYPSVSHADVLRLNWIGEISKCWERPNFVLAYGQGRSYGDSCLNDGNLLIDVNALDRLMQFDQDSGILRCEAGVTLDEILAFAVPRGWFLPVTPGTKHVTLGGAIANDVHGKNHHKAGTLGCHVTQFELARSSGQRLLCSPNENGEFFKATIGGLGLTGLVLWAEIQLKRISTPQIDKESIRFSNLDEFLDIAASSDRNFEYTVAWIDNLANGRQFGRGIFLRGNHRVTRGDAGERILRKQRKSFTVPCFAPNFLLNRLTMKTFSLAFYHSHYSKHRKGVIDYEPFFYPLDALRHWNRLYGSRGFLQYQCVVPCDDKGEAIKDILHRIADSKMASFLSVLKLFGSRPSPGMLSFPRPGVTLALDFAYDGEKTCNLLDGLDDVVRRSVGRYIRQRMPG